MFAFFQTDVSWTELLRRTYRESLKDDILGLAAQLAYYFFLALFPALLCLIAVASFFPLQSFTDDMVRLLGSVAPVEMLRIVQDQMSRLAEGENGGILSVGLVGALWSSSSAMTAVIGAMNRTYDIEETRPWWRVRLTAILLTLGLTIFVTVSFALIIVGPEFADWLAAHFGLGQAFAWTWKIVQWPVAFALVSIAIGLIYFFAPDAQQEWVWITPGSLLATVLWVMASLGFRYYVVHFGSYEAAYGAVGGVIVLMLWFYMSGLAIVIGGELSAELEHASPWGKDPGERIAGEKRRIGLSAFRAYRERWRRSRETI